jgi:hypothetical protein
MMTQNGVNCVEIHAVLKDAWQLQDAKLLNAFAKSALITSVLTVKSETCQEIIVHILMKIMYVTLV